MGCTVYFYAVALTTTIGTARIISVDRSAVGLSLAAHGRVNYSVRSAECEGTVFVYRSIFYSHRQTKLRFKRLTYALNCSAGTRILQCRKYVDQPVAELIVCT